MTFPDTPPLQKVRVGWLGQVQNDLYQLSGLHLA